MKTTRLRLFRGLLICFAFVSVTAAHHRRYPPTWGLPRVFSNLRLDAGTGDVGGIEVILFKGDSHDWAAVIMASGVAEDPALVPVVEQGYSIEFSMPPQRYTDYEKFTGTISRRGLSLFNDKRGRELLRKGRRAWGAPEVFSDLVLEPETGDVGGMEVILIKSYQQDWVVVMMASGAAEDPVLVPVIEKGNTIEFTLPPERYSDYGTMTARISASGMTLYSNGKRYTFLKRRFV